MPFEKSVVTLWCMMIEKNTHIPLNQDGGSVHVDTQKLDLYQMSMRHMHMERHKCDQTHFSVANFSLNDSDNVCDQNSTKKCPRNFQPPPWILP